MMSAIRLIIAFWLISMVICEESEKFKNRRRLFGARQNIDPIPDGSHESSSDSNIKDVSASRRFSISNPQPQRKVRVVKVRRRFPGTTFQQHLPPKETISKRVLRLKDLKQKASRLVKSIVNPKRDSIPERRVKLSRNLKAQYDEPIITEPHQIPLEEVHGNHEPVQEEQIINFSPTRRPRTPRRKKSPKRIPKFAEKLTRKVSKMIRGIPERVMARIPEKILNRIPVLLRKRRGPNRRRKFNFGAKMGVFEDNDEKY